MQTKSLPAKLRVIGYKADGTPDGTSTEGTAGQFEAIVSVFDNVDSYGDVIRKGAFTKSLEAWQASGDPIPIYYSHRLDDPDMNIGHVISATETDKGLQIIGQLDLQMQKAEQVHRLFKGRRLTQFSFSYAVPPGGGEVKVDPETDQEYNELTELDVFEVGPTPVGANSQTELIAVKDALHVARGIERQVKAGRMISDANMTQLQTASDALGSAKDAIDAVIAAATPSGDSGKASSGTGTGKAEDPARGKAEDPNRGALHAGTGSIPLLTTSDDALTALSLIDVWSIANEHYNHQGAA